jgi:hypothetical protein
MPKKKTKKPQTKPSLRAKKAFIAMVGNGGNVTAAMREAGYSEATINTPGKLTKQKSWQQLMEKHLPDSLLTETHENLLRSTRLDHMVFPRAPLAPGEKEDTLPSVEFEPQPNGGALKREHKQPDPRSNLTDDDICKMLADVNCTVRKIVHSGMSRHVYFWSADNRARKDGLDLAYKLKGSFAPEKKQISGTFSLLDLTDEADKTDPIDDTEELQDDDY